MHFNTFKMCPKVAHKKICPNMPKWHGLDLGQEHPQVLKTIKKVHTSQISRLTPKSWIWSWTIGVDDSSKYNFTHN